MDHFDRRLCLGGMLLFFTGCVLGFIVPAYAPHRGMLAAHMNAVQTGIFLLVLALLWPKLQLSSRMSAWLVHLTWISFWVLQACLTLGAHAQVDTVLAALKPALRTIETVCVLGVTLAVAILLFELIRRPISQRHSHT
jgi:(hydroxyamino)benzene mutase